LHHKSQFFKHFGVLMTKKAPFCASLRLIRTVFNRPQIKVRPKGLHKSLTPDPSPLIPNPSPLTSTKDYVRNYKLFLQNEPKFQKVKFNVNKVLTKGYGQMDTWSIRKNEPKRTQNEAKTNPIKANKIPKQTQFKPKQTQFRSQKMLPPLTINTRPNPLGSYTDEIEHDCSGLRIHSQRTKSAELLMK
jgi:hypothetical protein